MLQIRFNRVGKRNVAHFRVVLQEHTVAPGGKHVEILGSWDPHRKLGVFDGEKINYWISKGAQVSDSAWNVLIKQGIVKGEKRAIKISKETKKSGESEKPAGAEAKTEVKEIKKEEAKKEEIKTKETRTEKPEKEEIKKKEKTEEKKPEEAKPEEKK